MKSLVRLLVATMIALAPMVSARAAELRIGFDELTRLVQSIADGTYIYLNSAPGGLFTSYSYIKIGMQKFELPTLGKEFPKGGSIYAYHVNDMSSTSIRVSAINRALRLTVTMESDGPEAVPSCVSGDCPLLAFLPQIEWTRPTISIDFLPVHYKGSVSLQVKDVVIGGVPQPVCGQHADFWARTACNLGRAFANQSISKFKSELPKTIKQDVNQSDVQQRIAEGLKAYLTVGQAGAVAIERIAVAPHNVTVNFRFSTGTTTAKQSQ
jgi:hypothetical protein